MKKVSKVIFFPTISVLLAAGLMIFLLRPPKPTAIFPHYGLEIKKADGIPLLWDNGLPYFTRFSRTNHIIHDLAGEWRFSIDPDDKGVNEHWYSESYNDSNWETIQVPVSWNAENKDLLYYKGTSWFKTTFFVPQDLKGLFNRLVLDGVSYHGQVFLNGENIGAHQGGFSRWNLDISKQLRYGSNNELVIAVDNRRDYFSLPALQGGSTFNPVDGKELGWWDYGGIHRQVFIESSPQAAIAKLAVNTDHEGNIQIEGVLYNHGPAPVDTGLTILLNDLSGNNLATIGNKHLSASQKGIKGFSISKKIAHVLPWSPETPENRYQLVLQLEYEDNISIQSLEIGFRKFEIRGTKTYLNGEPIFLRGINKHEDFPGTGPVLNEYWLKKDMVLLKELNVNFMRPAHYPQNPLLLDECDRQGILITHEIPGYQLGSGSSELAVKDSRLYENSAKQLIELIERDRNHPSVIIWSIGNEHKTDKKAVKEYLQKLYTIAKQFDSQRPVTFALFTTYLLSPFIEKSAGIADILFVNQYYGWYYSSCEKLGGYLDRLHKKYPEKPIVVSEFGAGSMLSAPEGEFTPAFVKRDYTQEYQAEFYKKSMEVIRQRDYIAGTMPWVFSDYRDDKRNNDPVHHFNLKGLLTYEREKKMAFDVVAGIYREIASDSSMKK